MDFGQLYGAFKEHPTAALLVVALLALGWLGRYTLTLYGSRLDDQRKASAEHLATAMIVAPLASKLVDCVVLLDRAVTRNTGGDR
jgi:hypothetical protein